MESMSVSSEETTPYSRCRASSTCSTLVRHCSRTTPPERPGRSPRAGRRGSRRAGRCPARDRRPGAADRRPRSGRRSSRAGSTGAAARSRRRAGVGGVGDENDQAASTVPGAHPLHEARQAGGRRPGSQLEGAGGRPLDGNVEVLEGTGQQRQQGLDVLGPGTGRARDRPARVTCYERHRVPPASEPGRRRPPRPPGPGRACPPPRASSPPWSGRCPRPAPWASWTRAGSA